MPEKVKSTGKEPYSPPELIDYPPLTDTVTGSVSFDQSLDK